MDPSALYAALENAIPTLEPERQSRLGSHNPGRGQGTAEEERPEPPHTLSAKYIAEYDSRDAETAAEDITDTLIFLSLLPITIPGRFMRNKAQRTIGRMRNFVDGTREDMYRNEQEDSEIERPE
ncbi:hypothetical protein OEA41_008126 [Lepraria neglecta]|uniref:Uncharacterized protein n=1 Tax=Lepraria neglecta TaxID=209136 RepID=A0AAE0DNK8_9LECA|nr:hypothetical protein OEA41_008126 [Lepraria neglecta]